MAWSVVELRALEVDWMNAAGPQATTFNVERPAGDILASIPAGLSLAAFWALDLSAAISGLRFMASSAL